MDSPFKEVIEILKVRARWCGLQCVVRERFWKDKKYVIIFVLITQLLPVVSLPDIVYYSKRFTNMKDAPKLVGNIFITVLILAAYTCYLNMFFHKDEYFEMMDEMENFHKTEAIWAKPVIHKHFQKGAKRQKMASNFITFLGINAYFSFLIIGICLDLYFQNSKYPLPTFYRMSFLPVEDKWTYIVNFVQQATICLGAILNYQMISCAVMHLAIGIVTKFNTLVELIELCVEISEQVSFEEWYKEVDRQMEDIRRNLSQLGDINKYWFYIIEKICFFAVLTSYLMFHIDAKMMGVCVAGLNIAFGATFIVFLNEMFFSKFEDVNEAVYDLPWYSMDPKHRKYLVILLSSSQKPIVMSSAGITDLTLEWWGSVVKGGYSAGLVMKDLISI